MRARALVSFIFYESSLAAAMASKPGARIFSEDELVRAEHFEEVEPYKRVRTCCASGDEECITRGSTAPMFAITNLDMLYIYHTDTIRNDFINHLKTSLSKTLTHFPSLAGRLDPTNLWCVLNNAGAAFTTKHHDSSIHDIPTTPNRLDYQEFPSPQLVLQGKQPLLSITIHQYKDGVCIAINMSHAVADAHSFAMFVREYGNVINGRGVESVPVLEKPRVFGVQDDDAFENCIIDLKCERWPKMSFLLKLAMHFLSRQTAHENLDRALLKFTPAQVNSLKNQVIARMQELNHKDTWVSSNEALSAFIHTKILDLLNVPGKVRTKLGTVQTVGYRGKIRGLTDKYLGNAVGFQYNFLDFGKDWTDVAIQIHEQMRAHLSNNIEMVNSMRLLEERLFRGEQIVPKNWFPLSEPYVPNQWNSQLGFDFAVDLGLGKPSRIVHWMIKEQAKLCKDVDGNVEFHMYIHFSMFLFSFRSKFIFV